MRAYPQSTKQYRKTDAISTEWDVGLTLPEDYQPEVDRILMSIASMDVAYVLVGGVEFVMPKLGLADLKFQLKKSGDTVGNYHVHIALIFKEDKTRDEVLSALGRHASEHRNYCAVRNAKYPYITWKYHHIKPEGKLTDPILLERGTLPDDDILDPETCETIKRLGRRFGAGAEVRLLTEHLKNLEQAHVYKRKRSDPDATRAKAQARLDKYTENLEKATTEEDKKKWSVYIKLVKRDHFPDN